ncbi:MAG: GNAT family N-acetyltransferase [Lachnospiraceae bacterium]|nr:GNAT family N-acetyltransferase [Lachnospiraceae bacterium]
MEGDKKRYAGFIKERDEICIYNMPFWLDAVCGRNGWDAIVIGDKGETVAALPYHKKTRYGISGILQPQFTQFFDLWLKPLESYKAERALYYRTKWTGEIAERLSALDADFYVMNISGRLCNGEPFIWEGFRQEVRYSFVIPPGLESGEALSRMDRTTRAGIRKATGHARLEEIDDTELLYRIQTETYARRGMKNPWSKEICKRLYRACRANNACRMAAVRDTQGEICCAGLYVFDKSYVYELLAGTVTEKRPLNYKAFMTNEMIKFACDTGRGFDLEGSMVKSIAEHNRRFGAGPVPYYRFRKICTGPAWKRLALSYKLQKNI